ncbi:HNH endonuclease signature motif containing protein [Tsukamurella sp. PLM1]|uniref:HNH endonuclease signature motif containing protein n=1 Tax=Tsukamurella sp. PLM1 TaxID=2929795 RepID=UPI002050EA8D|nr:HNH endonuclease signature motif containing protein [Tsukamurella sp. PLM1]BDH59215.1 hypothetical protein MTP03_41540 [Tsukamurella sp. PLM1]
MLNEQVAKAFDERITAWLATRCGQSLSVRAVTDAAKSVLVRLDPAAARETPPAEPRERLEFHTRVDGLVDLEAVMPKDQALRLSALVGPLVQSVCRADGRTVGQRQVAALVALAEGYESLGCLCGTDSCELREARPRTAAVSQDIRALAVIVLNESDLADVTAAALDDAAPPEPEPDLFTPTPDAAPAQALEDADATGNGDAEVVAGGGDAEHGAVVLTGDPGITGPVTVEQARALIAATQTQWRVLGRRDPATGEIHARGAGGYRPTWYQLLVMRLTYPTCVFPGCSVPSDHCQADHVGEFDHDDPGAGGATTVAGKGTAGNLVPLCGFHHRIKTETGWLSDLLPDGTVEWRHPAGGVHAVPPGSARDLLPGLEQIIWDAPEPAPPKPKNPDGLATAAKRRAKARKALRAENQILREEHRRHRAAAAEQRAREQERAQAEAAGIDYDDTQPLQPPPF